jgi:hypothetical protein
MPPPRPPARQLAFVSRHTAEKERQLGQASQLAFVYRDIAEKERQFAGNALVDIQHAVGD